MNELVDEICEAFDPDISTIHEIRPLSEMSGPSASRSSVFVAEFASSVADDQDLPHQSGLAGSEATLADERGHTGVVDVSKSEKGQRLVDLTKCLEGYEIIQELGSGGMGSVWQARERSTDRNVAIKFLYSNRLSSEQARSRFEREVRLAAKLEDPRIARFYGTGIAAGRYFYVMELVDGDPLDRYVRLHSCSLRETLALVRQICLTVDYAHNQGIVHRDLKPSNVLVTKKGTPRLVDFGLAKYFESSSEDSETPLSVEGNVTGSPGYMAPEQAAGQGHLVDRRTDVYQLGAILYKLLTGQHPHDQRGPLYEVVRRIIEESPRSPRSLNSRIDRDLESILMTALARDPDDRYPTALMLADDIERYLTGQKLIAHSPAITATWRTIRNHWLLIAIGSFLVMFHLAAVMFIGHTLYQDAQEDAQRQARQERIEQRLDSLHEALNRFNETRAANAAQRQRGRE